MTAADARYLAALSSTLWNYRQQAFSDQPELFDRAERTGDRPPVFTPEAADHNLILPPDAGRTLVDSIRSAMPQSARHLWFRSMKRSQALAQSVFGGLAATDPKLVPYGAMTATFYTGLGCLLGPSVIFIIIRAIF